MLMVLAGPKSMLIVAMMEGAGPNWGKLEEDILGAVCGICVEVPLLNQGGDEALSPGYIQVSQFTPEDKIVRQSAACFLQFLWGPGGCGSRRRALFISDRKSFPRDVSRHSGAHLCLNREGVCCFQLPCAPSG